MPNPGLRGQTWQNRSYRGAARNAALNNKHELVGRGDGSYAVIGIQATSSNKYSTTPFTDFSGECGLMRAGDYFVQIHDVSSSGGLIGLTKDGDVFFKGYNTQGWAGNGHTTDVYC